MSGVSLGDELETIADAVSAAVRLAEQRAAIDPEARAQLGVLALVVERLRLVRRVVKGDFSVEVLAATHNRRAEVAPDEDGDVVLPVDAQRPALATRRRRAR